MLPVRLGVPRQGRGVEDIPILDRAILTDSFSRLEFGQCCKPATAKTWENYLETWLNPHLGQMPVSAVNNLAMKELVTKMAEAKLSAKSIHNYIQVAKMVVASAMDEQGEELYPRKWNPEFIDLPEVKNQHRPTFTSEGVSRILVAAEGQWRVLWLVRVFGLTKQQAWKLSTSLLTV